MSAWVIFGLSLTRFVLGAIVSAAVWAGMWIGLGYLIGAATPDNGGVGIPCVAVITAVSVVASLSATIPSAGRAIIAMSRSRRNGAAPADLTVGGGSSW